MIFVENIIPKDEAYGSLILWDYIFLKGGRIMVLNSEFFILHGAKTYYRSDHGRGVV